MKDVQGLHGRTLNRWSTSRSSRVKLMWAWKACSSSLPADQRAEFKKQIEDGKRNAAFLQEGQTVIETDLEEFKKQYADYLLRMK
jgi:hypothetical protein